VARTAKRPGELRGGCVCPEPAAAPKASGDSTDSRAIKDHASRRHGARATPAPSCCDPGRRGMRSGASSGWCAGRQLLEA
jgi:hypothetical protein